LSGSYDEVQGPRHDGPDFGEETDSPDGSSKRSEDWEGESGEGRSTPASLIQPFADLPEMPGDISDAFDQLKLALLHHKTAGWKEFAQPDALKVLDALKSLVTAPADEDEPAPF